MQSSCNLIRRVSSYLEDVHVVFQLLQLLHPLLDDILDFRLSDHQDFLPRQHDNKEFSDHVVLASCIPSLAFPQIGLRTRSSARDQPS